MKLRKRFFLFLTESKKRLSILSCFSSLYVVIYVKQYYNVFNKIDTFKRVKVLWEFAAYQHASWWSKEDLIAIKKIFKKLGAKLPISDKA